MKEVKIAIWGNSNLKEYVRNYLLWCGGKEFEELSYSLYDTLYWIDPETNYINYDIKKNKNSSEKFYYIGRDNYKISIKDCQNILLRQLLNLVHNLKKGRM